MSATRGLLVTDYVILNHGQVTWTTPKLSPPLLTTTPHQWVDVSVLDRFNVHLCPTQRVFCVTGLEHMTCQRDRDHWATAAFRTTEREDSRVLCMVVTHHATFTIEI
ncbi:uncharacterized protein TNCV_2545921 [Trichonephila clavipes]|nr:uncharacterized protein TNCV_2545921 [Trichonephila clavipes]